MSSQTIPQLADAVKAALNTASLALAFSAVRVYGPELNLENLKASDPPSVFVYPQKDVADFISRDAPDEEIVINVAVLKKLAATVNVADESGNATIDPLVNLCQQIATGFAMSIRSIGSAGLTESKLPLMFDPDLLRNKRTFFSVVSFTFQQSD